MSQETLRREILPKEQIANFAADLLREVEVTLKSCNPYKDELARRVFFPSEEAISFELDDTLYLVEVSILKGRKKLQFAKISPEDLTVEMFTVLSSNEPKRCSINYQELRLDDTSTDYVNCMEAVQKIQNFLFNLGRKSS